MFERLEETISNISSSIKIGATTLKGTINLNTKIEDEKKIIAKAYGDLGEKFFADNKDEFPEEYADLFEVISESANKIDDYKAQLKKLSGIVVCPECGMELSKDFRFCMACGAELPKDEPEEEVPAAEEIDYSVCQQCGAKVQDGALFCVECGAKLPERPEDELEEEEAEEAAEEAAEAVEEAAEAAEEAVEEEADKE